MSAFYVPELQLNECTNIVKIVWLPHMHKKPFFIKRILT